MRKNSIAIFTAVLLLGGLLLNAADWKAHKLPRTHIFTQGQLKYTLNPNYNGLEYYSHWTDWPLFIDSSLKEDGKKYRGLQYPDYVRIQKNIKEYALDGVGFWEAHTRFGWCSDIIGFTARSNMPDFHLFPLLSSTTDVDKDIPRIMGSPQAMRINGKILLYGHAFRKDSELAAFRDEIRAKFGDKFLFTMGKVVNQTMRDRFHGNNGKIPAEDQAFLEKEIRDSLKQFDGFGWWDLCTMIRLGNRRKFDSEYYRALMQLTAKVFKETNHKDKLLIAEAVVGHENPSSLGYILSSEGTKTLRDSLLIGLENGADIINIPEWDEQNENTSLRPTVYNGTSHMRIMRHLMGKLKGKQLPPLASDNPSRPDLILSMRKIIALGEKLEFELLNVPNPENQYSLTAQLNLKSIDGKILHSFPPCTFNGTELQEYRPSVPSEKFASERVLLPELLITRNGKMERYADGFSAVQIQATWNFDYKWVKQPLRDLMEQPEIEFALTPGAEENIMRAEGKISADEELGFAEVLDNGDCIYSACDPKIPAWRETESDLAFRIGIESLVPQEVSGRISLENTAPHWKSGHKDRIFKNAKFHLWHSGDWVRMPRKDLDKAFFDIDFPGYFTGKIPVGEIMKKKSIILGGQKGFNLALTRQLRQYTHPQNLKNRNIRFSMEFAPDMQNSVIQLQLIAQSGKLWRTKPVLVAAPSKETVETFVYSETEQRPVKINIPKNYVPDLNYAWNTERGLIVATDHGRTLWGIRGGYTDLSSLRNCGGDQSGDGTPCGWRLAQKFWKNAGNLAPEIIPAEDGTAALKFNGNGEHVAFPKGTIPRRSGFTLTFQIKPEDIQKKQYLLSNRQAYPGAFVHLFIENGTLRGTYVNDRIQSFNFNSAIPLKENEWNDVRISYDLSDFVFDVNGEKSKKFPARGPGLYDTSTLIGTWEQESFRGLICNFRIRHSL